MPEDIALFIDFENIRYSMLNIQRREPDPQELIAVARRYGTVMVARAYADWSRQPEPFKGSLTAAMIDRVDCPAKQRDRIRLGTGHYPSVNQSNAGGFASQGLESSSYQRPWPSGTAPLPAVTAQGPAHEWPPYQDSALPMQPELDENLVVTDESLPNGSYGVADYQPQEPSHHYQGSYGQDTALTGISGYPNATNAQRTGNTGHLPAFGAGNTVVQNTVVQSTVDLNMLMDIIETVFDRPTISTFVLMTGDKDFTRISARLKLRLNKTVIVVGIPGTVSRDLVSSANQFVPLVVGGNPALAPHPSNGGGSYMSPNANTGPVPAISLGTAPLPVPPGMPSTMEVLDPQFLQFLDYIDRNWSWRTVIGVSNFIGDPVNPKNRFRGRLTRESARELLNMCIQEGILILQTDPTGAEDLRLNRLHPGVDEVLQQFVR